MSGVIKNDCTHQRLARVNITDSTLKSGIYRCEDCHQECNVPLSGFNTPSVETVTMSSLRSISSHRDMDVDDSVRISQQVQSVTMHSISSAASDHKMEVIDGDSSTTIKKSKRSSTTRLEKEFEFLEELGKGGFGLVGKYRSKNDRMIYAIKITKTRADGGEIGRTKMKQEVEVLCKLEHGNIVRYYNCWPEFTAEN